MIKTAFKFCFQIQLAPLHLGAARPEPEPALRLGRSDLLLRQGRHGRAVQVDPINPTLKAPGNKRLKVNFDEPLSNFACIFNLRRCSKDPAVRQYKGHTNVKTFLKGVAFMCDDQYVATGRACLIYICPSYILCLTIKTLRQTPHLDPQREPS